jgi:hypothetical protein
MVLILISAIFTAIVVAISITRYYISFGSFTSSGVAGEEITTADERAEQTRITSPMKQFLVVVLPDGKVVNPG